MGKTINEILWIITIRGGKYSGSILWTFYGEGLGRWTSYSTPNRRQGSRHGQCIPSDFDDMNFQYAEVPWYPDPPTLDLWRRHGVLPRWAALSVVSERNQQSRIRFSQPGSTADRLQIPILYINTRPNQNAPLKPLDFLLTIFDFPIICKNYISLYSSSESAWRWLFR